MPRVADRAAFQAEPDRLRVRKAHTPDADAIAAARRRLPMVEMERVRYRDFMAWNRP